MMRNLVLGLMLLTLPAVAQSPAGQGDQALPDQSIGLLTRDQAAAVMPATVFFKGKTAPIQARNSAGLRISGKYVLIAMVDTSGYSSAIQESYQAYLITETTLMVGGHMLAPGSYGVGFVAGDKFLAVDLGGTSVLEVTSVRDSALPRPNPLQIIADPTSASHFRLYSGRSYVDLVPAVAGR